MMEKMADKIEGEADKESPGSVNGEQLIHGEKPPQKVRLVKGP